MLCFEGSEALCKLNAIIKQLYKISELHLLSKSEALNKENLAKARILHTFVTKNLFFYIFCFYDIL